MAGALPAQQRRQGALLLEAGPPAVHQEQISPALWEMHCLKAPLSTLHGDWQGALGLCKHTMPRLPSADNVNWRVWHGQHSAGQHALQAVIIVAVDFPDKLYMALEASFAVALDDCVSQDALVPTALQEAFCIMSYWENAAHRAGAFMTSDVIAKI